MARILYFATLVDQLGRASEELPLPDTVRDVRALVAMLHGRGKNWVTALDEATLKVTVNRQFAELDTPIDDNSEIAFISMRRW
jgi:molybdopterin synthase sulfur carrier subunit